jgi:S-formylglutathione hydrolase
LGEDRDQWKQYDAAELLLAGGQSVFDDILIDVGTADGFLKNGQLLPEVVNRLLLSYSIFILNKFFAGI